MKNKDNKDLISRQEALKKMGKYAGLTALGTFMILSPNKHKHNQHHPIRVDLEIN